MTNTANTETLNIGKMRKRKFDDYLPPIKDRRGKQHSLNETIDIFEENERLRQALENCKEFIEQYIGGGDRYFNASMKNQVKAIEEALKKP